MEKTGVTCKKGRNNRKKIVDFADCNLKSKGIQSTCTCYKAHIKATLKMMKRGMTFDSVV
jgi:hypothetical protein